MKEFPIIKYFLVFALGIVFQRYLELNYQIILGTAISLLLLLIIIILSQKKFHYKIDKNYLFLPFVFVAAILISNLSRKEKINYPFTEQKIKNAQIVGEIVDIDLMREKKLVLYVKAESVKIGDETKHLSDNFICNVSESKKNLYNLYNQIEVGNKINVSAIISRPRNQRNPFEFDYEKYLQEKGITFIASVYKIQDVHIIDKHVSLFTNSVIQIRKEIDERLKLLYNKTTYDLLRGLLLADRTEIEHQINDDFINVGVIHVLAVSGLHVGFIVVIFLFLFSRFNIYLRTFLTLFGLFSFMILTGSGAPVVRATLMTTILLVVPLFGRSSNGINSLAVAALIILLFNPNDLFNPSFQLSFSAILSLILIAPKVNNRISKLNVNRFAKYFLLFLGTTFAAQIGTLPFTLLYFGKLSLAAFIGNLFVIPTIGIIVGLGITSLVVSLVSIQLAIYYASLNELITYLMISFIHIISTFKYSSINIGIFSLYDGLIFYTIIGMIFSFVKYFSSSLKKIAFVGLMIILFFVYEPIDDKDLLQENQLSILAIDIGQGDAFLIKFPNNKVALIDAGNADQNFDNGKRIILPLLNKLGINQINYAFVSHVDADHYKGFLSLIRENKIEEIYKPYPKMKESKDIDFESFIKKKNIKIHYYKKEKIKVGNSVLYVLNDSTIFNKAKSNNDMSGIIKLVYGQNSFLFTGDLGVKMEKEYIRIYHSFLKSDLLKAGHHGSKTSSSFDFLNEVEPKYALISAGLGNKFKHPSKVVIERMNKLGIKIYRTDQSGAILLNCDGIKISSIDWRNY